MLTQLSTLKARLGLETFDTTDDTLLTNILKHVSARFAADCNRIFDYGEGLTYEFPADEIGIFVDHTPIEAVSEFALKTTEAEGLDRPTGCGLSALSEKDHGFTGQTPRH